MTRPLTPTEAKIERQARDLGAIIHAQEYPSTDFGPGMLTLIAEARWPFAIKPDSAGLVLHVGYNMEPRWVNEPAALEGALAGMETNLRQGIGQALGVATTPLTRDDLFMAASLIRQWDHDAECAALRQRLLAAGRVATS